MMQPSLIKQLCFCSFFVLNLCNQLGNRKIFLTVILRGKQGWGGREGESGKVSPWHFLCCAVVVCLVSREELGCFSYLITS